MAQDTPIIELIVQNRQAALENIRRENTYRLTVNKVSRVLKHWDEISQDDFPALFVSTGGSDLAIETNKEVGDIFNLIIWGYVRFNERATPEDIAQVQMIKLKSDVIEAMFADPTCAGHAQEFEILSFEHDEGALEPIAVFRMLFKIKTSYSAVDTSKRYF